MMTLQFINWHPVATSLPDSDITVMVAIDGDSEPVWMAHHDGTAWLSASQGIDQIEQAGEMMREAAACGRCAVTLESQAMTHTTARDRLQHAIHAWAEIRSDAHATALNAQIESLCIDLDRLRQLAIDNAAALADAQADIDRLQREPRATEPAGCIGALADLCEAYRARIGLDGAWDEPLVRAEAAVIAARTSTTQIESPAT